MRQPFLSFYIEKEPPTTIFLIFFSYRLEGFDQHAIQQTIYITPIVRSDNVCNRNANRFWATGSTV